MTIVKAKWTPETFKAKFWIDITQEELDSPMKKHTDPSVIEHMEQVRNLEAKYPERNWAYNMSREQILEFWPDILDWNLNELNEILKEKWFEEVKLI